MTATAVRTFRLGLLGYPLGHSLSPALHRAALDAAALAGDYSLFPVKPDGESALAGLLARVRSRELSGLNVTIPHKQRVIPLLDKLTVRAKAIGAVNTIYMEDEKLTGDNTDAPAFFSDLSATLLKDLSASSPQSQISNKKSALVLGAGGSARAVVYALMQDGWEVLVAARRIEQATVLQEQFQGLRAVGLNSLGSPLSTLAPGIPQLIVNATPIGMSPNTDASPWPGDLPLPVGAMIYDLIYNPRESQLVRAALSAGLRASGGLGMLIEQAALAFNIWTGHRVARNVMREAVEA